MRLAVIITLGFWLAVPCLAQERVSATVVHDTNLRSAPVPAGEAIRVPAGTAVMITEFVPRAYSAYVGVQFVGRDGYVVATDLKPAKLLMGMSRQLVYAVMGYPIDVNRTITENLVSEQLVYGKFENRVYVYLENGRVTAIQD